MRDKLKSIGLYCLCTEYSQPLLFNLIWVHVLKNELINGISDLRSLLKLKKIPKKKSHATKLKTNW